MPITLVSSLIESQTLDPMTPTLERIEFFEKTSKQPFEFKLVTGHSDVIPTPMPCPMCSHLNHLVTWVAPGEKGFAQPHFAHTCENMACRKVFTKGSIGVRRFSDEVSLRRTGQPVFLS